MYDTSMLRAGERRRDPKGRFSRKDMEQPRLRAGFPGGGGGQFAPTTSHVLHHAPLPEEPERYFTRPEGTVDIPLGQLLPMRARPDGIARAEKLMRSAYVGARAPREPITVRQRADGTYDILDGNSTYAVAKAQGWASIPAMVSLQPLEAEAEAFLAIDPASVPAEMRETYQRLREKLGAD